MTEKEKLKKLKELADAMYYAAQYLTTDASRLHKAMDEYHNFIIHECKEEPVKIKRGCKYRCLSDMVNIDTGNISFIGGRIYLAPKDDTLVSEENGCLCDTSEDASNFKLVEEPVTKDKFTFTSLPRLLDMIKPTDRVKWYSSRLADALEEEGYITDAKIVRESIKIMNGEKVPMATMDEEPVNEDLEEASKEWLRPQLDKSYANYGEAKMMELTHFDGYAMLDAIEFGAEWQQEKDSIPAEYLEELINKLSKQFPDVSFAKLSRIAVRVAKWQKEKLWKPADGDDLPIIDREVMALLNNGRVVFAHRPPEYWDGKNIDTGEVTRYYPKTYDKGGWNIPDVKYWLNVELPKK